MIISVPWVLGKSLIPVTFPPKTVIFVPRLASTSQEVIDILDTEAIEERASPRNP